MKPTINFKYNGLREGDELSELMEAKLASIEKYLPDDAQSVCDVEFAKVTPQQHGPVHRVEVNCSVNGELFRAESTKESFQEAIDEVRDELDKELRRHKQKQTDIARRAGRAIKHRVQGVANRLPQ